MNYGRPPVPNGKTYGWLALAFMAFVVYASWAPFNFTSLPLGQAVAEFREVVTGPLRLPSRSDWVANVLLMLPVSFFLMGALGADRPRAGTVGDAFLVLPVCLFLSAVVEFGQLFVPNRLCSLSDIVAQGFGAALGALGWVTVGQRATEWGRRFWGEAEAESLAIRLLPGYLVMLGGLYLVPLDLTLSPGEIYHKWKAGGINLIPFHLGQGSPYSYVEKTVLNVVYMGGLGLLLAGARWRAGWIWAFAFAFPAVLNGLKVFVVSRGFDVTDVILGTLAVLGGWRAGLSHGGRNAPFGESLGLRVGLLAAWLALLAFVTWQPFDVDPDLAGQRLADMSFVPFVDIWSGNELWALRNAVEKFVLYLPLGFLLTSWRPGSARREWLTSLAVGFGIALILEAGQLVLASRTATLSDVYIETAGAVIGSLIVQRARGAVRPRWESQEGDFLRLPGRPVVFPGGRR